MSKIKNKTILLTGATGLLGSYLLKIMLERGHKVYVISRHKGNEDAASRVKKVVEFWDKKTIDNADDNLIIFEGDITKKNIGLSAADISQLENDVEDIFHCAANTGFNQPFKMIKKINVEGFKNVLDLTYEWIKNGRTLKVNHISTAYVCGSHAGIFTEKDLDVKQTFNSPYERSKFEAEKLAEDYREKGIWIDIFRPAAIVGESKTGKIFRFEHIYQLLRLWGLESLDVYPIEGTLSVDLICIDDAANAIYTISRNTNFKNNTYHIFGPSPLSTKEIFDLARKYIGFKIPKMVSWEDFNMGDLSFAQRKLIKKMTLFSESLAQAKLDSTLTQSILEKYNSKMSSFTRKDFKKIIQYAIKLRFLKQRSKR